MPKKKIVLFYPRVTKSKEYIPIFPLSVLAASRLLVGEYDIIIVDHHLFKNPIEKILEDCKDAVCFGVSAMTSYQIYDGLMASKLVKKEFPNLPIVWGGWHPSIEPETTVTSPFVDIVVRGQGEITFRELIDALSSGRNLEGILGISYKNGSNVFHNPDRPVEDIKKFPPIPYELVDVKKILLGFEQEDRSMSYITSYGCPFRCGFCSIRIVFKGKWSGMGVVQMVDEMEDLKERYGVDHFRIMDPNFFVDRKRIKDFCRELIARGLDLKWDRVNGRADHMSSFDEETFDAISKAGCKKICVGAESGWQEALDFMQKDLAAEKTVEFAKKCKRHGIMPQFFLMVGLPWKSDYQETRRLVDEEIKRNMDLADVLMSINRSTQFGFYVFTPYPGSPLFDRSVQIGFKPPNKLEEWSDWVYLPELVHKKTPWMTDSQVRSVAMINYMLFFMNPDNYDFFVQRLQREKKSRARRFFFKNIFKAYRKIAEFRWKRRFFSLPIDYWLYCIYSGQLN